MEGGLRGPLQVLAADHRYRALQDSTRSIMINPTWRVFGLSAAPASQVRWHLPPFCWSVHAAATPSVSPRAAYAQRDINILQHVFRDHFASFAAEYGARYAKELGNFRVKTERRRARCS